MPNATSVRLASSTTWGGVYRPSTAAVMHCIVVIVDIHLPTRIPSENAAVLVVLRWAVLPIASDQDAAANCRVARAIALHRTCCKSYQIQFYEL